MNIFLSCTKEKADKRCKACEMYMPSSLFAKSYEYAKSMNPDKIYILSAKHHLLPLSRVISPYNETLNDASVDERKAWTEEVVKQMKSHGIDFNAKTYFFCGENYIEFLKDYFPNSESVYEKAGGGIGEIMHWLDNQIKKIKESKSLSTIASNNIKNLYESLLDDESEQLNKLDKLSIGSRYEISVVDSHIFNNRLFKQLFNYSKMNRDTPNIYKSTPFDGSGYNKIDSQKLNILTSYIYSLVGDLDDSEECEQFLFDSLVKYAKSPLDVTVCTTFTGYGKGKYMFDMWNDDYKAGWLTFEKLNNITN